MDPEGPNGQDVIFIRSLDETPEDAYRPTLIPVTPAFSPPPSSSSTSSNDSTFLVLQLSPLNHPSTSSKHRPIVEGQRTTFLPATAFWSAEPTREVDEDLLRLREEETPEREMYSESPGHEEVGLGVNFGDVSRALEGPRMGRGVSDGSGSQSVATEKEAGLEDDSVMETESIPSNVMTRSSFGTRELLESFDWASTSLGPVRSFLLLF